MGFLFPSSAVSRPTYAQTVASLGAIGYWDFGDISPNGPFLNQGTLGTTGNATPTGNIATCQNGPLPFDGTGSIHFSGTSGDRVTVPNNAAWNTIDHTVSGPFRYDGTGTAILVQKAFGVWRLRINSTMQIELDGASGAQRLVTSGDVKVQKGRWFDLTWVHDGTNSIDTLYMGDLVVAKATGATNKPDNTQQDTGTGTWSIGQNGTGTYNGCVSQFKWFNRALSAAEVMTLVAARSAPGVDLSLITGGLSVATDAAQRRVLAGLANITALRYAWGIPIWIEEFAWPDTTLTYSVDGGSSSADYAQWAAMGGKYLNYAKTLGISRIWWDLASRRTYFLNLYDTTGNLTTNVLSDQSTLVESYPTDRRSISGVNLSGASQRGPGIQTAGSIVASGFSNNNPGTEDSASPNTTSNYRYETASTLFTWLSGRTGAPNFGRIGFRKEALWRTLGGASLDATELGKLHGTSNAAGVIGMATSWQAHNYGGYVLWDGTNGRQRYLNSAEYTMAHMLAYIDLVVAAALTNKNVSALEFPGNEPSNAVWSTAALYEADVQLMVDRARAAGWNRRIVVPFWNYCREDFSTASHPVPFVDDLIGNVSYAVHDYWDDKTGSATAQTGQFATNYASLVTACQALGY